MVPITALWQPIVLSAVIVFVASSVMHTVLKYHNSDFRKLPDEDKILAAIRPANVQPGMYVFPHCSQKEMKSPAMTEKFRQGPVGMLTMRPNGPPHMPKFLIQWFVFCLVVGAFVACLAGRVLAVGTPYPAVFRVAGTAAFLAYGLGHLSDGIWKGQSWSSVIKEVIDGLIYGLLTAGTFGWLWPR
jgi:hypothetical protein